MKEFYFKEVGKRMPYSVPEGFFEEAEHRASTIRYDTRVKTVRWITAASIAVAAIAAVLYIEHPQADPEAVYADLLVSASMNTLDEMSANYMENLDL